MANAFNISHQVTTNTTTPALQTASTNNTGQNMTTLENCKRLQFQDYIPWNNSQNIVSMETEFLFDQVRSAIILPLLFLIGGPANVINMAVFYRQGLKERINLCLFALALADELYLLTCMLQVAERVYLQFAAPGTRNGPMLTFIVNHNLLGFFGFAWVSQIISAVIACERCFCVVSPLRSRSVLTTRTMGITLGVLTFLVVGLYFLVATRFRMICALDPLTSRPLLMLDGGEFYYRHQELIDALDSLLYGITLPGSAMLVVLLTTGVTVVKLRQAVAWRSETSGAVLSSREVALTRMLVANSVLALVCLFPFFAFKFLVLFVLGMKPGSRRHNLYFTLLWVLETPSFINSAFNFLIYYTMGSRYRLTLRHIFCSRRSAHTRSKQRGRGEALEH